jgi:O-antigen/teichoic acid export membrane protein
MGGAGAAFGSRYLCAAVERPALTMAAAKSPDAAPVGSIRRRLARGSSVYGLTTFGLRALGFALLGIYSRYFSPRDYGIVSLAESIGALIGIVASLALENGSRRLYFQFADDAERLRSYLGTVLRLAAACSVAVLVLCYLLGPLLLARFAPGWSVSFFPYLALPIFTAVASQLLVCRLSIYQCEERLAAYTGFIVLQSLSTTVFTFGLVVWTRHGAAGLLAARALGAGVSLLAAVFVSTPYLRIRWRWSDVRETLQISLPLVPQGLLLVGLVAVDRFILQHYRPLSEVGLYTLAYNIGYIMTMVTGALSRAWTPLFFSMLTNGDGEGSGPAAAIFDELVVLLLLIASAGVLLAPYCIYWLFNSHYWPAGRLAPILLGGYLCHSLFVLFQIAVIHSRRTTMVGAVSGIVFLVNVALSFAWVPRHGMAGEAYANLAAYALEVVLIAILAQRVLPLPHRWGWPSIGLLIFAAALAWSQLVTALLPTLAFAGALATACALGLMRYLQRRTAQASAPQQRGNLSKGAGLASSAGE